MGSLFSSDRAWQRWGEQDPYFAVLTDTSLHRGRLTPEALAAFFASGDSHAQGVIETIRRHLDPAFRPRRALDFGSGVGRILIPLASLVDEVVGMDVSPAMLSEARRHADERNLRNVSLVPSDDTLSSVSGAFDLVHTCLVLQHIPVRRGERIIRRLLELLSPGGVAALHVPYARDASLPRRAASWARGAIPGVHGLLNLARGVPWGQPLMQMNLYDHARLYRLFEDAGIERIHGRFLRDGEYRGVMLFGQRPGSSPAREQTSGVTSAPSPGADSRRSSPGQ